MESSGGLEQLKVDYVQNCSKYSDWEWPHIIIFTTLWQKTCLLKDDYRNISGYERVEYS
jgi:hypothetical protein